MFCQFEVMLRPFTAIVLRLAELAPITALEFSFAVVGKFGDGF